MRPIHGWARVAFIVFALAIVSAVIVIMVMQSRWAPSAKVSEQAFEQAFRSGRAEEAIAIYNQALSDATTAPPNSVRSTKAKAVAEAIEDLMAHEADARYAPVVNGKTLSTDDELFFRTYDRLTARPVQASFLAALTAYMKGEGRDETMRHILVESLKIDAIRQTYGSLSSSFLALVKDRPEIVKAEALMRESQWLQATKAWLAFLKSTKAAPFSLRYAQGRLDDAKRELLAHTLDQVTSFAAAKRYYSAHRLLSDVVPLFPNNDELLAKSAEIERHLPKAYSLWSRPVDHIAIRPLIASAARAFDNDIYAAAADRYLLLTSEFKAMLKALYDNGYVLVSHDLFLHNGTFHAFRCPEGKKPLVLVFDNYHFSPERFASGTVELLTLDREAQVVGATRNADGTLTLVPEGDAVAILEAFVREHPDFSFNGAKAVIAVPGKSDLFGHVTTSEQAIAYNKMRLRTGTMSIRFRDEDIAREGESARAIAKCLSELGYEFACNGYDDLDVAEASLETLKADLDRYRETVTSYLGVTHQYVYPRGIHANFDKTKTKALTDAGYTILMARGTNAYFAYGDGYAHIDMNVINGDVLRHPERSHATRFFDASRVLDRASRPKTP